MKTNIKPLVKWAGGKTKLLPQLSGLFPPDIEDYDTFIEPFVGGGAVLFYMLRTYPKIKNVVINDINQKLMNVYFTVKENPLEIIAELQKLQNQYWELNELEQKEFYLKKRDRFNFCTSSPLENAVLFIFLNKTCFNGLYRENKKGHFNVPFGKYVKPVICNRDTIINLSALLQKITILNNDYANIIGNLKGKTFIYFDPPYRPLSKTSAFTSYTSDGFDDTQQKRLASFCHFLDFDSKWMLSNSSGIGDNFFQTQYNGFKFRQLKARRSISANAKSRGQVQELLITNY
ncbi:DNA adenine methylase [Mariniphaga anaerophila]|uniref:Site-specific DNA-methyltransferase (adenine-specific) n=1 Tax=Mariniphaga anaerophila TaxID=1484053 RepID=A0A1M4U1X9_9BACT|nr:DNA adenine methylase [Mariniphaga anaerophila]SHE50670.1 DNA adenine methylase [Mariniphaga anaerophila]